MILNYFVVFCVFYLCILWASPPRYISCLPSLYLYPRNKDEVKEVARLVDMRTSSDEFFFYKTDKSVSVVFAEFMDMYSISELDAMIHTINPIILLLKYSINRARPKQIDETLHVLNSNTSNTPSYPAGHAFQAYYLAKVLSQKHPNHKDQLESLARKCDMVRVKAGIHFPSDGAFAKKVVDSLFLNNL